jgi:dihydrofolate reductase
MPHVADPGASALRWIPIQLPSDHGCSCKMRPLRYSINVTLDGCVDHRAIPADEALHRHATETLAQADALLFGRVTYEMMEAAWRLPAPTGARPEWMEPFARTIDAAKKYVVSSTLDRVDWNAELVRGDLGKAVQQLKREPGKGLLTGGVKLPLALTELGIDRRVRVRGASQAGGPRTDVVRGAIEPCRLEAREPAGARLGGGGDAV